MREDQQTPDKAPIRRAEVERQFEREVDLRDIELPDWEFITRVADLLMRYASAGGQDSFWIRGRDNRGSYNAPDLNAFRAEQSGRGEDLGGIRIQVLGQDEHGLFMYSVSCRDGWGKAEFQGGDEVVVNGVAARVEQLAKAAKARLKQKEEEGEALRARQEAARRALEARPAASAPEPRPIPPGPARQWWNHPWTITIVGGVVAAVIAGLILLVVAH
jgi:hypothetical protein